MRFRLVSPALSGISSNPTLSGATQTVTPSCGFAPLQGFLPKVSPVTSRCGHLLQGFPGRSAYSFQRSPHTPEGPIPRVKVRIQGFSPSFRFTPPLASRVYFTPLPPFGFPLQGFPLPRSRACSSPALCRLAVLHRLASRILVLRDLWRTVPTVLGVGRMPFTGFTALLPLRVRSVRSHD